MTLQSTFGTTIKAMRESMVTRGLMTQNGLNIPTVAPVSPNDGDIYFDKNDLKLQISMLMMVTLSNGSNCKLNTNSTYV